MVERVPLSTYIGPQKCRLLIISTKGTIVNDCGIQSQRIYQFFHQGHLTHRSDGILNHNNQMWVMRLGPVHHLRHFGKIMIVFQGF